MPSQHVVVEIDLDGLLVRYVAEPPSLVAVDDRVYVVANVVELLEQVRPDKTRGTRY